MERPFGNLIADMPVEDPHVLAFQARKGPMGIQPSSGVIYDTGFGFALLDTVKTKWTSYTTKQKMMVVGGMILAIAGIVLFIKSRTLRANRQNMA